MWVGACCCGATHGPNEFKFEDGILYRYGRRVEMLYPVIGKRPHETVTITPAVAPPAPTKAPRDEHDQPLPNKVEGPNMQDLVIQDIQKRLEVGIQRYGSGLKAHNGRDSLLDAYEESLDLCIYLRQVMFERDGK